MASSSSSSSSSGDNMVTLKSRDGVTYKVKESMASLSVFLKNVMEDSGFSDDTEYLLPNVDAKELVKIIEYCEKHVSTDDKAEDIDRWDKDFVNVDLDTLYDLILAANYMDIKGLLDLVCEKVANIIKGKSPEDIRKTFNIKNDFTREEEAEIRKENQWAFE